MSPDHQHLRGGSIQTILWSYYSITVHVENTPYACIQVAIHGKMQFCLQGLCDVILEAVFPSCAMFRLVDVISDYNTTRLSLLRSGKAHFDFLNGVLLAGSMAEGLTMQQVWGHPASDADLMVLFGAMLGVTIPDQVATIGHHVPESTISSPVRSIVIFLDAITYFFSHQKAQLLAIKRFRDMVLSASTNGDSTFLPLLPKVHHPLLYETSSKILTFISLLKNESCLEYAPEGCPLAYTRIRGINIGELPYIYAEFFEEEDGQHWLKTSHLNQQIQQCYNLVGSYPSVHGANSGPAGQVRSHGKWT